MQFSTKNLTPQECYKVATSSVIPRPIALVSTKSKEGVPNLAPFSFFTVAAYHPFVLVFFPLHYKKGTMLKDTLINIQNTQEAVISIVTEAIAPQVNLTSGLYDDTTNEFEISGLTPQPATLIKPFLVKESPINFECTLYKEVTIGDSVGAGTGLYMEVQQIHVWDHLIDNYKIDMIELQPVARLAGPYWSTLGDLLPFERPVV